jgi:hypothetical protein
MPEEQEQEQYRLEVGSTFFTYVHKPSYEKAKAIAQAYPVACEWCVRMMNKFSAKVRHYNERKREYGLNEAEYKLMEKAEESYNRWEKMLDDALAGKPSEIFVKSNNLKLPE